MKTSLWDQGVTALTDPENVEFFVVPDDAPPKVKLAPQLTAAAEPHDGAMMALVPSNEDAVRLALPGYEPVEQLHCTLMFLGPADLIPDEIRLALVAQATAFFATQPAVEAEVFGFNLWNPLGDRCVVGALTGEDLADCHDSVVEFFEENGFPVPEQHEPWTPHVTLAYPTVGDEVLDIIDSTMNNVGPITFDTLRLAFGGVNYDIPLWSAGSLTAGDAFHLAGKHNQKTHGHGGGAPVERLDGKKLRKAQKAHDDAMKHTKRGDVSGAVSGDIPRDAHYAGEIGAPLGGYRDINGGLDAAHGDVDHVTLSHDREGAVFRDSEELRGSIRMMDDAMDASHTSEDIVVHRVIRDPVQAFGGSIAEGHDNAGVTWQSHRYTSTTTAEDQFDILGQAERLGLDPGGVYSAGKKGMVMRIRVPKGTHALKGHSLDDSGRSEHEILIDRGTRFRIIRDHGTPAQWGDGRDTTKYPDGDRLQRPDLWHIDVEVLPD